jgi:hypothetical protein
MSHFREEVRVRSDVERPQRKTEHSGAGLERPLQGGSRASRGGEDMMMMGDNTRMYGKDGWMALIYHDDE